MAQSPAFFASACAHSGARSSPCGSWWLDLRWAPAAAALVFLCVVAYGLLRATGPAMRAVVDAAGPAVALLVVFVPVLAFAFWSAGVLMRAVIARIPHGGY